MKVQTVEIGGMSCGHCVARVRSALSGVPGIEVRDVRVGSATIVRDEARASDDDITAAIAKAGYAVAALR